MSNFLELFGVHYHRFGEWTFYKRPKIGDKNIYVAEKANAIFQREDLRSLFLRVRESINV